MNDRFGKKLAPPPWISRFEVRVRHVHERPQGHEKSSEIAVFAERRSSSPRALVQNDEKSWFFSKKLKFSRKNESLRLSLTRNRFYKKTENSCLPSFWHRIDKNYRHYQCFRDTPPSCFHFYFFLLFCNFKSLVFFFKIKMELSKGFVPNRLQNEQQIFVKC